ncbi:hypothetical protein KGM_211951 [Danaus plexippus plexippus]|uniref:Neurogenic protein mastermind-like n=1 Tax=Danaus plexippus plexippus TaxID=278856 RepID=A0A212FI00_DANPL|nr:hypothetical protein KGM_211951 [Danaus plexippus plexippus]
MKPLLQQQKFGCVDYEPPAKIQCGGGGGASAGPGEGLTKFSVEIVQQLEFTTSAADSQPQQISTNVTVKALANAVKTSGSPPPPPQPAQPSQPPRMPSPLDCERECKAECKSEAADDEFVGLDECAAALERDAASAFPGLADLIGEDDGDDAFEYLITEISEYPELMKDFDLDGGKTNGGGGPGAEPPRPYGEMSPAAQTLKHMAEQHQQAAGGDWARFRGYNYRPRPPPPALEHLHMTQQQQMHLSQPHNLQVSAAQHMQVSSAGGLSVAAQQGMYAGYSHQAPSPSPHHQGNSCDSYSVSQSQSIKFSPSMRPRAAPPQQTNTGPAQGQPLGIAAAGISREQQAKMLQQQQQQMLRAQQQQMRPPPPEYKARFAARRPAPAPAPAPRAFAPHGRQYPPDWRHVLIQQQNARQQFPHHLQGGNFNMGGMGGMGGVGNMGTVNTSMAQQQQMQLQQARLQQQQQQLMQHQQQRTSSQQQSSMSQLMMQQNQVMTVQAQVHTYYLLYNITHDSFLDRDSKHIRQRQHRRWGVGGPRPFSTLNDNIYTITDRWRAGGDTRRRKTWCLGSEINGNNNTSDVSGTSRQMPNIHMSQSQSMSMAGMSMPHNAHAGHGGTHAGHGTGHTGHAAHAQAAPMHFPGLQAGGSFAGQAADFNLDFLDSMPSTDASSLTAQELLNSLDNSFLSDIL